MRPVHEHLAEAASLVEPVGIETISLAEAWNRVAAVPVAALSDGPPFDNSAMDGYAVRVEDANVGTVLPVRQDIAAGITGECELAPATAARIMTGAPVPAGADAIVPVEHTDAGTARVTIFQRPALGAHIRRRGEDVTVGDQVVPGGAVLGAWQLAAVASVGHSTVAVRRRPVVAVLTTGDELVAPGVSPGPGQIVDSNSTLLAGLIRSAGATPLVLPRVGDTPGGVLAALAGIEADLIVTTGGASVGAYDPVKADLASRGVQFHAVAMQPGKPQGLGRFDGIPIACLPGNPVSAAVTFHVVVGPMLRGLLGAPEPRVITAPAGAAWKCPAGRHQYVPAVLGGDGSVRPASAAGSRSHMVASLAHGRVLAVVPAEVEEVREGDPVGVMYGILETVA